MNIEQYDQIQPLLVKAHSIVLVTMCVSDDCHATEMDGALWAAKDLINEAMNLLAASVPDRQDSDG